MLITPENERIPKEKLVQRAGEMEEQAALEEGTVRLDYLSTFYFRLCGCTLVLMGSFS